MVGVTVLVGVEETATEAEGVGGKRKRSKSFLMVLLNGGSPSWVVHPVGTETVATMDLQMTVCAASVWAARARTKATTMKRPKLNLLF